MVAVNDAVDCVALRFERVVDAVFDHLAVAVEELAAHVDGLVLQSGAVVTVNGMLSMPERSDALDRIRLGDAGILLTSPEQLRNRGVVEAERHAGPNQFAARFLDQDEVRG